MSENLQPETTLGRVLELFPGAQRALFRRYHIGGCASCAFDEGETLENLARRNSLDVAEVIAHIQTSQRQDDELLIAPREAAELLAKGQARLVDVRSRDEFEAVRIEGAQLFSQPLLQEILARWPRSEMLIVCDHHGKQSLDAAAYFLGQGFGQVRCLRGGIDAWAAEVDPKMPRYDLEYA